MFRVVVSIFLARVVQWYYWPKKLKQAEARKPNIGARACSTDHAPVPRARGCFNFFCQGSGSIVVVVARCSDCQGEQSETSTCTDADLAKGTVNKEKSPLFSFVHYPLLCLEEEGVVSEQKKKDSIPPMRYTLLTAELGSLA